MRESGKINENIEKVSLPITKRHQTMQKLTSVSVSVGRLAGRGCKRTSSRLSSRAFLNSSPSVSSLPSSGK